VDRRFAVAAYRFPELIDWEDFKTDDPDSPHTFVQAWPPDWSEDEVQAFLGRGRWVDSEE